MLGVFRPYYTNLVFSPALAQSPYIHVLNSNPVQADGKELMKCNGGCQGLARYCSREHQKAHWERHKMFCQRAGRHAKLFAEAAADPAALLRAANKVHGVVDDELDGPPNPAADLHDLLATFGSRFGMPSMDQDEAPVRKPISKTPAGPSSDNAPTTALGHKSSAPSLNRAMNLITSGQRSLIIPFSEEYYWGVLIDNKPNR